jgi:hypothetical protein
VEARRKRHISQMPKVKKGETMILYLKELSLRNRGNEALP